VGIGMIIVATFECTDPGKKVTVIMFIIEKKEKEIIS
jgi:hypothetical protein